MIPQDGQIEVSVLITRVEAGRIATEEGSRAGKTEREGE
jgi:hypothetical protein